MNAVKSLLILPCLVAFVCAQEGSLGPAWEYQTEFMQAAPQAATKPDAAAKGALAPLFGGPVITFIDAIPDTESGTFLVISDRRKSGLIRVSSEGKEQWSIELPFAVSSISAAKSGVYLVGGHYILRWHTQPPAPVEVKKKGLKRTRFDKGSTGATTLLKVVALETGGCVATGKGRGDKSDYIYHSRIAESGKVVWQKAIPCKMDWMFVKPSPFLALAGDKLVSVGAYATKGPELSAFHIRMKDGKTLKTYSPKHDTCSFVAAALHPDTGDLAVAYNIHHRVKEGPPGVRFLNSSLTEQNDIKLPIFVRTGLTWLDEERVWLGGSKGKQAAALVVNAKKQKSVEAEYVWQADQLLDDMQIKTDGQKTVVVYSADTSPGRNNPYSHSVTSSDLVVRVFANGKETASRHKGDSFLLQKPKVVDVRDTFGIAFQGHRPRLVKLEIK